MNDKEVCPKCNNTRVIQETVVCANTYTVLENREMPCNWCRVQQYREAIVNQLKVKPDAVR